MPESATSPEPDVDDDAPWVRRFRAARISLPMHARMAPDHCVLVSNASGTYEVYAWDRATGQLRQATDRPNGTVFGGVDPDGAYLVWFADTDGDEFGVWMRQPFAGVRTSRWSRAWRRPIRPASRSPSTARSPWPGPPTRA